MNLKDDKYKAYFIVKEMLESIEIIERFAKKDAYIYDVLDVFIKDLKIDDRFFLSGEGSSRVFPAKNLIYNNFKLDKPFFIHTDGSAQALEYNLKNEVVFVSSNSGQTKESLQLIQNLLKDKICKRLLVQTTFRGSPIEKNSDLCYILKCGKEEAVAATKSVIEQALFLEAFFLRIINKELENLEEFKQKALETLELKIDKDIIEMLASADTLYFAGRNDGVSEELRIKTLEITRQKSDFLEGTFLLHGAEETIKDNDVVILVEPFLEQQKRIKEYIIDRAKIKVIAISSQDTIFKTIKIPALNKYQTYLSLFAGWNLLVEVGIRRTVNIDKPERARKIGNQA